MRFLLLWQCVALLCMASANTFRPPSVPLAVSSPFFSIWSDDAFNLQSQTVFWNGNSLTLDSLLQVDGITYVLMGASQAGKPSTQLGLPNVTALSSTYAFTAGGVHVTLRFTTPALPDDFEAASRGGTYIAWTLASIDGVSHNASVLFDTSGEAVTGGYTGEELEWCRPDIGGGALALRIGLTGQHAPGFNISGALHRSKEPHQLQDFGFVYVLVDGVTASAMTTSLIASASNVHSMFVRTGALPGAADDAVPPAPAANSGSSAVVLGVAFAIGMLPASGAPVTLRLLLLCDPVVTVLSYDQLLPPLWRKDFPIGDTSIVPSSALVKALVDGDALLAAADALDASLASALASAGGTDFAKVAALTFRQVMGADGVTWNGSSIWAYQKEISSDGDLSTLDVIFPSAAQHIYFGAATLAALLEPLLFIMADFYPAHKFSQPCSLHSAGKWPVVDAGDGGCSMPMESTGDVLLLAAAVTMARNGSAAFAAPYMPLLRRFADFCDGALPFPSPQDMTDDFSHAPGNLTNLALKCIIGLGAQAYQEQAAGNASGAVALYARASARGTEFAALAPSDDGSHFKFIYNETWDGSYGLMYNAFWARLLGLEWTIPNFRKDLTAHYEFLSTVTANATWCIPLSSIEHDSKWDWLVYSAANAFTNSSTPAPSAFSAKILAQLVFFANTTSSRFPLTDHPECTGTFPPAAAADRARPVLGAFFAPLLISSPPPAFISQRAAIEAFVRARDAGDAEAVSATLSWFSVSDTHLGHDPVPKNNGTMVTSFTKNEWAIDEMNGLPTPSWPNGSWPASLGGGLVLPPVGVTVSGDLIDAGDAPGTLVNGCHQWSNFTTLYGLDGTDGRLKYKLYEGRGNHDGGNTTNTLPYECLTVPSLAIAARNKLRVANPDFNITNVSAPTSLHYSWDWSLGASCKIHFVHLNLFPGHSCGSPSNPGKEGTPGTGFNCASDGWTWPEDSLTFLKTDLAKYAAGPGVMVVTLQHYGLDSWSNTWCECVRARCCATSSREWVYFNCPVVFSDCCAELIPFKS